MFFIIKTYNKFKTTKNKKQIEIQDLLTICSQWGNNLREKEPQI